MDTPQVIYLILVAMSGTVVLTKHGESRPPYNFWYWIINASLALGLLYWGEFFS